MGILVGVSPKTFNMSRTGDFDCESLVSHFLENVSSKFCCQ